MGGVEVDGVTVRVTLAVTAPDSFVTVIVTVPLAIAVTSPSPSTVETDSSLDVHTNTTPTIPFPFASSAVAVSFTQFEAQTVVEADAMVIFRDGSGRKTIGVVQNPGVVGVVAITLIMAA